VVSKSLSGVALCESATSFGSDFVSVTEGVFCDMTGKTLYPLCAEAGATDCFDQDAKPLVRRFLRREDGSNIHEEPEVVYDEVLMWD